MGKCATFSSGVRGADETFLSFPCSPSQHPLGRLVRQAGTVHGKRVVRAAILLRVTHSNSPLLVEPDAVRHTTAP